MHPVHPYPFDFLRYRKLCFGGIPMDEEGLPRLPFFHPVAVAQAGLFYYNTGNEAGFIRCSEALLENAKQKGRAFVWEYDFSERRFSLQPGWVSAMAQGEAISLLTRYILAGGGNEVLEVVEGALVPFHSSVEDGGVAGLFPDGTVSLEEYPAGFSPNVLNGMMFALIGLCDAVELSGLTKERQLFDLVSRNLASNLHLYDTGFWSLYLLKPVPLLASVGYHRIHIELTGIMHKITGNAEFKYYHDKWRRYLYSPENRIRFALGKLGEKISFLTGRQNSVSCS
ncbi:hypothetical protein J7K18_07760 [bacterium]|nr:hypothetical protein [bacterium]